eukprot:816822-Prymnesium_polylepis.2
MAGPHHRVVVREHAREVLLLGCGLELRVESAVRGGRLGPAARRADGERRARVCGGRSSRTRLWAARRAGWRARRAARIKGFGWRARAAPTWRALDEGDSVVAHELARVVARVLNSRDLVDVPVVAAVDRVLKVVALGVVQPRLVVKAAARRQHRLLVAAEVGGGW